jgi:hypothetical protein
MSFRLQLNTSEGLQLKSLYPDSTTGKDKDQDKDRGDNGSKEDDTSGRPENMGVGGMDMICEEPYAV